MLSYLPYLRLPYLSYLPQFNIDNIDKHRIRLLSFKVAWLLLSFQVTWL